MRVRAATTFIEPMLLLRMDKLPDVDATYREQINELALQLHEGQTKIAGG